jgi:hypothetical protein
LLLLAFLGAAPGPAREVEVPLRLDHEILRRTLVAQLYTGVGERAVLWDDGAGCGSLVLREPRIESAGERLRLLTAGEARVGTPVASVCLFSARWEGLVEARLRPEAVDGRALGFGLVDTALYDREGREGLITGRIWKLVAARLRPSLEAVRLDLEAPVRELRELLPLVLEGDDGMGVARLLASLRVGTAAVSETGVTVPLVFTAPVRAAATPVPEPPLTAEELGRFQRALEEWDAFLTFIVKEVGRDAQSRELGRALRDVLIEARVEIVEALVGPAAGTRDPVPALFLRTWDRLAPVLRRRAPALPAGTALHYLSFVAAGDALAALERMGPESGLDLSSAGLRRLARILAPLATEDPLVFAPELDPELRAALGFGPAPPAPDLSGMPAGEEGNAPEGREAGGDRADGGRAGWRRFLGSGSAYAADGAAAAAGGLERWLPPAADGIETYLRVIAHVLEKAGRWALADATLEPEDRELYRHLLLATAWQESCWRQFTRRGDGITYLRSRAGAVGLMQVNERVWRGLYDLDGLRWDIRYNGRAGAEILRRYLEDHALASATGARVRAGHVARIAYAVYNGGPGVLARLGDLARRPPARRVDQLFWRKFEAVRGGREMEVARCIVGG